MQQSSTTQCNRFGHREITVSYAGRGVVQDDVVDLLQVLEHMVASGSVFKTGQTIQVGWLVGQFRDYSDQRLTLYEPDLHAFPVSWSHGVTNILVTKRLQLDVADSLGLREAVEFSTFGHSCLVCTEYTEGRDFIMSRWTPEGRDSGWFVGCNRVEHDHNNPANLRRVSTYELVTRIGRDPLMYLALPSEAVVRVVAGRPRFELPGREVLIVQGSFLDALFNGRARAV